MARRSPDGESRLDYVATIADPEAPTAAELNAGVPLTGHLLEWNLPESGNTIDTADMGSSFNKQDLGTFGGDAGTLTAYRDDETANDDAWSTLPRLTRGYLVERLFGGSDTTYAAADVVTVYQGAVSARSLQGRTRNTALQFQVIWAMTGEPLHDIAVT